MNLDRQKVFGGDYGIKFYVDVYTVFASEIRYSIR